MEKLENVTNERPTEASPKAEMSDESDSCKVIRNSLKLVQMPKVIQVKPTAPHVSCVKPIKTPIGSGATKLDKIVNNLKSMKEQQMKEKPLNVQISNKIPRVSLINVKKESEEEKIAKKENEQQLKPQSITRNETQTSLTLFQQNILNYNFIAKEEEESQEKENDLTNLSWLTSFNLNVPPLSPPLTPPQVQPAMSSLSSAMSRSFDDDEADGCHQMKTPISTQISQILRDCVAQVNKTCLRRPPFSFSSLAFMAIESSERKRLSIKEIYNWIIEHFPYYQSVPSGSWKNSIRFNLANNKCFAKVDKNQLAMRDFSGKGSLWCTSATYRAMLLDQLIKTNDVLKVTSIQCLQDKHESFKMTNKSNRESPSSAIKSGSSMRFRNNNLPKTNIIINPLLVNRFVVKPKLTNVSSGKAQHNDIDQCSELDAVNALLSMKTNSLNQINKSSSMTSANNKQEDDNKKGRRKSLFRRPVKNTCVIEPMDEEKQLNEECDEEEFCNSDDFEDLNDDGYDNLEYENERAKRKRPHEETSDLANHRKHRRLLVKFPYFKNAQQNKANKNKPENVNEHKKDTELVNKVPHLPSKSISNSTKFASSRKKQLLQTPNALLQLSRAASLIEENK